MSKSKYVIGIDYGIQSRRAGIAVSVGNVDSHVSASVVNVIKPG